METATMQNASTSMRNSGEALVEVHHLVKYFPVRAGLLQRVVNQVKAVDDVSFFVRKGETLGLVGESGCGKTTVGRTMIRLIEPTGGSVRFDNKDVFTLKSKEMKVVRRDMQIIFQDPYASLDPRVPKGCTSIALVPRRSVSTSCSRRSRRWGSRTTMPGAIRTSFPAASASVSGLPAPWPCARALSFVMSLSLRWMCPSSRRS
jgi:alpha-D-ribose 1-methylphosphonate 5-triphosphate synthase subunit PhnL